MGVTYVSVSKVNLVIEDNTSLYDAAYFLKYGPCPDVIEVDMFSADFQSVYNSHGLKMFSDNMVDSSKKVRIIRFHFESLALGAGMVVALHFLEMLGKLVWLEELEWDDDFDDDRGGVRRLSGFLSDNGCLRLKVLNLKRFFFTDGNIDVYQKISEGLCVRRMDKICFMNCEVVGEDEMFARLVLDGIERANPRIVMGGCWFRCVAEYERDMLVPLMSMECLEEVTWWDIFDENTNELVRDGPSVEGLVELLWKRSTKTSKRLELLEVGVTFDKNKDVMEGEALVSVMTEDWAPKHLKVMMDQPSEMMVKKVMSGVKVARVNSLKICFTNILEYGIMTKNAVDVLCDGMEMNYDIEELSVDGCGIRLDTKGWYEVKEKLNRSKLFSKLNGVGRKELYTGVGGFSEWYKSLYHCGKDVNFIYQLLVDCPEVICQLNVGGEGNEKLKKRVTITSGGEDGNDRKKRRMDIKFLSTLWSGWSFSHHWFRR